MVAHNYTFTFRWRIDPKGDWYEQDIIAPSLRRAKGHWRYQWRLRIRDCHRFVVIHGSCFDKRLH